ncbi:hypothetical protein GC173_06415 [bacterium]|nr:hypothetical protein [bacterium]
MYNTPRFRRIGAALALAICLPPALATAQTTPSPKDTLTGLITTTQSAANPENPFDSLFPPGTKLLSADNKDGEFTLTFNDRLVARRWLPDSAAELQALLGKTLTEAGLTLRSLKIQIRYGNGPSGKNTIPLSDLLSEPDTVRARATATGAQAKAPLSNPVVQRVDYRGPEITRGLAGRNFVMGPSHGMTWHQEHRWQYQRARLWTIVEDLYPISYVNPFITPMLENAGANVFTVRERDWQPAEVIVDYPAAVSGSYTISEGTWKSLPGGGWQGGLIASLPPEQEPFREGSTAYAEVDPAAPATVTYVPSIPRAGRYAVCLSWAQDRLNSPAVPVTVNHLGGSTKFLVNQQVAGGTWVFLGFFEFDPANSREKGSVVVTTAGAKPSQAAEQRTAAARKDDPSAPAIATRVSIDAVRFGGGMANGAPEGVTSGLPRAYEAARYYLQYSGAPRDLVYLPDVSDGHFGADYNRDIVAKGEWSNYLTGAPSGPNANRSAAGLGVPIEAYLSFHTDAGVDKEGVYGTLMLSSIWDADGSATFPDGRSRLLNRDLGNLMQDELVRSARALYTSSWERRAHENSNFGEARRPNVPSVILELLAHQNLNDMKYGLDPRFKFDISRAIYKSLARFVAWQDGAEPVIQPLAPLNFRIEQDGQGGAVLTWEPQDDPLEPSATPTGYVLYSSRDGRSFDNGSFVANSSVALGQLPEGELLAFRVTAVNEGGESFPSPTLAMRWKSGKQPLLIVDGFDRLSGPVPVEGGGVRGLDRSVDPGVPYQYNYGIVGDVYDFNPDSEWKNDLEETGWGASSNMMEGHLEKGNTFDHSVGYGATLGQLDFAFDSTTLGGFSAIGRKDLAKHSALVWIGGRQRTVLPPQGIAPGHGDPDRMKPAFSLMSDAQAGRLLEYVADGGRILMSGAHVGEELLGGGMGPKAQLAREVFGVESSTARVKGLAAVESTKEGGVFSAVPTFRYGVDLGSPVNLEPAVYPVPAVDQFEGKGEISLTYAGGGAAASVTRQGILLGFPLESVLPPPTRAEMLKRSIAHLLER